MDQPSSIVAPGARQAAGPLPFPAPDLHAARPGWRITSASARASTRRRRSIGYRDGWDRGNPRLDAACPAARSTAARNGSPSEPPSSSGTPTGAPRRAVISGPATWTTSSPYRKAALGSTRGTCVRCVQLVTAARPPEPMVVSATGADGPCGDATPRAGRSTRSACGGEMRNNSARKIIMRTANPAHECTEQ